MSLSPGDQLGPYRIVEEIGRGGMATVYKARHEALERDVAIKVLPEFLAEQEDFRERFQQEAVAVAHLRHPSILAIHDYGEEDGVTYIVNEYVNGGTLAQRMQGARAIAETVELLSPVASALDYAHARSVVHRDVKPSNILLTEDGTPILADFGLAKMLGPDGSRLTTTGAVVGTPDYMAPEQCSGGEVAAPADIYALGMVAYEMLTGKLPFQAPTPAMTIIAQISKPLPPARSFNPELPEAAERALERALAKLPEDRFATAGELMAALATSGRASGTAPAAPPAPAAPRATPVPVTPPPTTQVPRPTPVPAASPPTYYPPSTTWTQAAPAAGTAPWIVILHAVSAALCVVVGGFFLLFTVTPDADTQVGAIALGAPLIALGLLHAAAAAGLWKRQGWARGIGFVAAGVLCLTCVGAALGGPLLYGLVKTRTAD